MFVIIRSIQTEDFNEVCDIVNENWKTAFIGCVNPALLTDCECLERSKRLRADFVSKRLSEYVFEEDGRVLGMLSLGNTKDMDRASAFELWRIYIAKDVQHNRIGSKLLSFAEQEAHTRGFSEIIIWTFKENIPAIHFYTKHGYVLDKEAYLDAPYLSYAVRLIKPI